MPRKATKKKLAGVKLTHTKHGCKVHPSKVKVKAGGTLTFHKAAMGTVYVQVFQIGRAFKFTKKTHKFRVPKGTKPGHYPYAVFCYKHAAFCTGSSMPIIIVPPRVF